jgi:putative ABC transport system permease protein
MIQVGWLNLRKDPTRTLVAVAGVLFSVVLITLEVGLVSGLMRNASLLIDTSRADLWISAPEVKTFDFATPFEPRAKHRVSAIEGVEKVEDFGVSFTAWKLPSGSNAHVEIVGLNVRGDLAPQLDVVEGDIDDIHGMEGVFVDVGDLDKLGNPKIGDVVEIFNHRAKIMGFTRGMKSFTTAPYIFTSHKKFSEYSLMGKNDKAIYLLVKLAPGADRERVKREIAATIPGVDVQTPEEFSWRTRRYWLIETGIGIGFLAAAVLGLLVGAVIVSQTLFAMTVEKLPEYGVLRAMGASSRELAMMVLQQGLICGALGLGAGLVLSVLLANAATQAGTLIEITTPILILVVVVTTVLCCAASLLSIMKLRKIEPAMVFRT